MPSIRQRAAARDAAIEPPLVRGVWLRLETIEYAQRPSRRCVQMSVPPLNRAHVVPPKISSSGLRRGPTPHRGHRRALIRDLQIPTRRSSAQTVGVDRDRQDRRAAGTALAIDALAGGVAEKATRVRPAIHIENAADRA